MRNIIFTFLLFISCSLSAQYGENSFSESESANGHVIESGLSDESPTGLPGNPDGGLDPDPVPIDDYIPLLVLTALGIIIYKTRNNRNLLS